MRKIVVFLGVIASASAAMIAWTVAAQQQQPNPRQQPGAMITMYAPEQHDLDDGHYGCPRAVSTWSAD
jgi:hypothetical protein